MAGTRNGICAGATILTCTASGIRKDHMCIVTTTVRFNGFAHAIEQHPPDRLRHSLVTSCHEARTSTPSAIHRDLS